MKVDTVSNTLPVATNHRLAPLSDDQKAALTNAREVEAMSGGIYDPAVQTLTEYLPTEQEKEEFDYRVALYHRDIPLLEADRSINAIEAQLDKVQKSIANERPDLRSSSWDLTIENGKLKVTGAIGDEGKQFIESKLNGNGTLRAAVNSFMKAASDYLETTAENPKHGGMSPVSGELMDYNFKGVQKQLEGKISFKELISSTWNLYTFNGVKGDSGNQRGGDSLEMLATRLTVSTD